MDERDVRAMQDEIRDAVRLLELALLTETWADVETARMDLQEEIDSWGDTDGS